MDEDRTMGGIVKIKWEEAVGKTVTAVCEGADDLFVAFGNEYTSVGFNAYPEGAYLDVDSDSEPNSWELVQLGLRTESEHAAMESEKERRRLEMMRDREEAEFERLRRKLGK